jgi:hypothetical protein
MEKEVPIIYLWLYKKLLEKKRISMKVSDIILIFKRNGYHIPGLIHHKVLKDMERFKLIKRLNRYTYQILEDHKGEIRKIINPILFFYFL